jgi:hypothetical protein
MEPNQEEEPPKRRFLEFPIIVEPVVQPQIAPLDLCHRTVEGTVKPYILHIADLDINPPHEMLVWTRPVDVLVIPPLEPRPTRSPFIGSVLDSHDQAHLLSL